MSENWGFKIKRLRESKGLSAAELSHRSGRDSSYISRVEDGHYKSFTQKALSSMAKGLGMSEAQLSRELVNESQATSVNRSPQDSFQELVPVISRLVPVRGTIPAGIPEESGEVVGSIYVVKEGSLKRGTYALKVKGDSLNGDKINNGDYLVVEPISEIDIDGAIYVLEIEGEGEVVRHVYKIDGSYRLISSNAQYRELKVSEAKVIGRAILCQPPPRPI